MEELIQSTNRVRHIRDLAPLIHELLALVSHSILHVMIATYSTNDRHTDRQEPKLPENFPHILSNVTLVELITC